METLYSGIMFIMKLFSYFIIVGSALGICDGLRKVNREQYYKTLIRYYANVTKSRLGAAIPIVFRLLMVSGIEAAAGRSAAAMMIVIYCVEASLIMTIGQRQQRGVHG